MNPIGPTSAALSQSRQKFRCTDGFEIAGHVFRPRMAKKVPGILFVYEACGMNSEMIRVADEIDTTLRDGKQAGGTRLGSKKKLTIARQLAQLKVDIIEAGYPASSPDDFEAGHQISLEIQGPTVCALSRAVPEDIQSLRESSGQGQAAAYSHRDGRIGHPRDGQAPR
jgi:hypothetical protein